MNITALSGAQLGWGSTTGRDDRLYLTADQHGNSLIAVVKNITSTSVFVDFERLQAKTDSNMEDQPSLVSFRE